MDESEFPGPAAWGDLDWLSEEKYNILKEKYLSLIHISEPTRPY